MQVTGERNEAMQGATQGEDPRLQMVTAERDSLAQQLQEALMSLHTMGTPSDNNPSAMSVQVNCIPSETIQRWCHQMIVVAVIVVKHRQVDLFDRSCRLDADEPSRLYMT